MLALLVGAGFSRWAADLPLASQLFDFRIEPFGVREQGKLDRIKALKAKWDSSNTGNSPEEFIAAVLRMEDDSAQTDLLWYIVRRLSEPYLWQEWHAGRRRRHVLMIDENRKLDRPGVRKARDFISQCSTLVTGIITPNYDLLLEYALGSRGFNYGQVGEVLTGRGPYPVSQWRNPVRLTGRIPIAKLHGSISWDDNGRYTDGRRGLTGDALIVAPTPEKSPPAQLAHEWALSERILRRASCLLVFGFAFNPYDEALLAHLRKSGSGIRQVAIVDVCPRVREAESVWPDATIRCFPPPPEDPERLRAWVYEVKE